MQKKEEELNTELLSGICHYYLEGSTSWMSSAVWNT